MNRRMLMSGMAGAALASSLPFASAAMAQRAAASVDAAKLPILAGGDFATATSQLARTKATNAAVRTFAEMEIAEQAAVARAFGAEPGSAGIPADKAAMLEELQAASGADFDRMYIDGQITGHRELKALHQRYARSGQDPMARGASMVGVTGIDSHLFILENLKRQI